MKRGEIKSIAELVRVTCREEGYYGHIHGAKGHSLAVKGCYDDIDFALVSGDYIQFVPLKVE